VQADVPRATGLVQLRRAMEKVGVEESLDLDVRTR
jgi:hypothetical protein